jgi:hypothetical protein
LKFLRQLKLYANCAFPIAQSMHCLNDLGRSFHRLLVHLLPQLLMRKNRLDPNNKQWKESTRNQNRRL